MKKIILLILITFSLSSCIKMDSDLYINDDFFMDWKIVFDYTILNSMAEWMSNWFWTGTTTKIEMPCDKLESSTWSLTWWDFEEYKCINISENIAEITGKWLSIKDIIEVTDKWYLLDLKGLVEWYTNDEGQNQTEEEKLAWLNMLKWMWFEMNYVLHFPSTIIESNIWEIDWEVFSFNVYDISNEDEPYLIYQNTNNNKDEKPIITEQEIRIKSKALIFKDLILTKKNLENSPKGKLYKWAVDNRVTSLDDEKLIRFHNLLWKMDLTSFKYSKYKLALEYMKAKIWMEIYKREWIEKE
jgi:hypothetical protein